jgi:hypothetical protein
MSGITAQVSLYPLPQSPLAPEIGEALQVLQECAVKVEPDYGDLCCSAAGVLPCGRAGQGGDGCDSFQCVPGTVRAERDGCGNLICQEHCGSFCWRILRI